MTNQSHSLSQWQLAPFHLGAAIGPMGGGVLAVLFAILMGAFDVDRATLSLAVPLYMFPYAALQLVSGGISDLTSRRASLLLGFGAYGAATLLSGLAPSFGVFLLGQALQGATNAFTTPILMATLGDVVAGPRLGRAMGFFSSANLAGAMAGPWIAGGLAEVSWRLVYVAIALLSWALMLWYFVWFRRHGDAVPQTARTHSIRADLANIARAVGLPVLLLASLAFFANGSMRGPVYLAGEFMADLWGTGVGAAGVILGLYGLAGLVTGPFAGLILEWLGLYRGTAAAMIGVALSLVVMALAPGALVFAAGNLLLGVTGIIAWTALNTLVLRAVPEHRGTAASIFGSAKFLAQGVAPVWFTPLYQSVGPRSIWGVAALLALALLAPLSALRGHAARREAGEPLHR